MDEKDLEHRLTSVEQVSSSNSRRLDECENRLDNVVDIAVSVRELVVEVKHMREDLNETIQRISKLESKGGESWDKIKWIVITGIVTALLGYFLGTLGLS